MRHYKFILIILIVMNFSLLFAFANDAEKYFQTISKAERLKYLSMAKVMNPAWKTQDASLDLLNWLNQKCENFGKYTKDQEGRFLRPTVNCDYEPATEDNKLDGMTPKFRCAFFINGKIKKFKIKYGKNGRPASNKETPNGIMSTAFTNYLGFAADSYCPSVIQCKGCPSGDPWNNNRSSAPKSNQTYSFDNAIIEIKYKGEKITEPGPFKKPQGFTWAELKNIDATLNQKDKEKILLEREALMFWNVFIKNTDADAHNNRLVCTDSVESGNNTFLCKDVIGYSHDYGDTFGMLSLFGYQGSVLWRPFFGGSGKKQCVGNLKNSEKGSFISYARFSEEARALLVERLSLLPPSLIYDVFMLAEMDRVDTSTNITDWVQTFQKKLNEIKQATCEPFASRKTVLGQ
ncbi:MAG: hypothetical protein HY072_10000 [Deltaproteobacteria bacterium]|nr:hypothetical protein [Deltaproteobacteria bacterium]